MNENKLKRTLTLFPSIMIVVTSVIGAGIFTVPGEVMGIAKGSGPNILAWAVAAFLVLLMALVYSELAASMPGAGGPVVFLKEAYNEKVSFFYGWFTILNHSAVLAVVTMGFIRYLGYFFDMSPIVTKLIGTVVLAVAMLTNIRGVKTGARFTNVLTVTKLIVIGFIIVLGFSVISKVNFQPVAAPNLGWSTTLAATLPAFFAFSGYNQLTFMSEEIKEPGKTIPKALVLGIGVICLVYILITIASIGALGVENLADSPNPVALVAEAAMGKAAGAFVSIGALISIYGLIHSGFMSMPRVAFSMGRSGLFPTAFGKIHPKFETPYISIIVYFFIACILLWTGTFGNLLMMVVFIGKIVEFLITTALVVLRKRKPDMVRPVKMPLYPVSPILTMILTAYIAIIVPNSQKLWSLAILASSIPAYFIFKFVNKKKEPTT